MERVNSLIFFPRGITEDFLEMIICVQHRTGEITKMGHIVPRVRIKPTSLASQASVLTIIPPRLSTVTIPSVYYYSCPPGVVSLLMLTITYIQTVIIHTYIYTG